LVNRGEKKSGPRPDLSGFEKERRGVCRGKKRHAHVGGGEDKTRLGEVGMCWGHVKRDVRGDGEKKKKRKTPSVRQKSLSK